MCSTTEYFSLKKLIPSGNIHPSAHAKKNKEFQQYHPRLHQGRTAQQQEDRRSGTAPKKVMFLEQGLDHLRLLRHRMGHADPDRTTMPIRSDPSDLIKRPIESWAELLNPEIQGQGLDPQHPVHRHHDAAMVMEAAGVAKYGDKGNMTKEEIDLTIKTLIEAKKAGQFRAFWKDFNESVNLMASGETVIQSMWSPASPRCARWHPQHLPAAEGRLSLLGLGLLCLQGRHGRKLDLAYEFVNWFLSASPVPISPAGLLLGRALHSKGQYGSLRLALLDGRQARAEKDTRLRMARCSRRPRRA